MYNEKQITPCTINSQPNVVSTRVPCNLHKTSLCPDPENCSGYEELKCDIEKRLKLSTK